jgi:2-polyprenyl-3-methyl-5-hydroxy-6-metoxy-1,4-benzoquinol methylase
MSELAAELQATYLHRSCPCCGGGDVTQDGAVTSDLPAATRTFEEIKQTWQHFFKRSSYFTYRRCAACGQLYCPVFFQLAQLIQLYSRMSDNTANLPIEVVGKTQRRYFDILEEFDATTGSYLELGPDIGLLTEVCAQKGSFSQLSLIEPNLDAHQELAQRAGKAPHQIFSEMDAYLQLPDASLDTVAMVHVLDHLLVPAEILRALKKKLRPGGKILIVTHDESSLLAKVLGSRWPAYCLQHPQLYNPRTISRALANEGFKVLGVKKTYNYFPVTYLLRHLLFALRLGKVPLPSWNKLTLPLRLGNIATVASA